MDMSFEMPIEAKSPLVQVREQTGA